MTTATDQFITRSPLVCDMLAFTVRSAVQMVSWEGAGLQPHHIDISRIAEDPAGHIAVTVVLSFDTDHSNGGSTTEWIVRIPSGAEDGLDNVTIRPLFVVGVEAEEIHWTEIGRHMLDFEWDCRYPDRA